MKKQIILLVIQLLLFSPHSWSQKAITLTKESVDSSIIEQIVLFPQEKIHLQSDKSLYVSGEKIWFRVYLVDAVLHQPLLSQYVFVELINPLDSVVSRVEIRQNEGAFSGCIAIHENLPEGDYTLCSYTRNMQNLGEGFFFKKNIRIVNPLSATVRTKVKFRFETESKLMAEVSFEDKKTQNTIMPEKLKIRLNGEPVEESNVKGDTTSFCFIKLPDSCRQRVLYVENKKCGKYISIPYPQDDYEVTFYPEGGYILDGVRCAVAIKALNSNGLAEKVTGKIFDSAGNEYTQVKTSHDGMGIFSLVSNEGTGYYAIFTNEQGKEKRFDLPASHKGMYSLTTKTIQKKLLVSVLHSSDIQEQKPLYLMLHTRGVVHYAALWDSNFSSITFDSEMFPSGVMQIILFDEEMNPLSERLVFCRNNDQAQTGFSTDHQNYKKRQLVNARANVTNIREEPNGGSFSVSITDDNDVKYDSTSTIMASLLLNSELKGYIKNPGFYLQENNPESKQALDLLMLTNGWRRYNIPGIIKGKYVSPGISVKPGMEIKGRVNSLLLGKPVEKGKVSVLSWEAGFYEEVETDSAGYFILDGIEYADSTAFIIQALNKKGNDNIELFVDSDTFPDVSGLPFVTSDKIERKDEEEKIRKYIVKSDNKYTIDNGIRMINLDEVVVTANATEKKDYRYSYYMPKNSNSSGILTEDEIQFSQYPNLSDIIQHLPFVELVSDSFGQRKVSINRMSSRMTADSDGNLSNFAVLIIDDVIISDYDIDNVLDPSNIERVAVLKGVQATLLGSDGAGGAIVITTKKGFAGINKSASYNTKKVTPLGYQKPIEFYSPRYETTDERNNSVPDLRTTIYWNPNVTVSALGEGIFNFYTSDASTTYTVVIEGITSDGKIIQSINKISRK